MPFTFTTNNRLISRWDGSNFQEEVLSISGADGVSVSATATGFTVSGNQSVLSGALQSAINAGDANAVASGASALSTYSGVADAKFVDVAGDTMTGFLVLNADPTASGHASTKQYVDAGDVSAAASGAAQAASALTVYSGFAESRFVNVAGDTMTGFLVLNADPTASGHAANKAYVDSQVGSVNISVQENNSTVYSGPGQLDFGFGLNVVSGASEAQVAVNESEFLSVVFLTGDQSISGNKTFNNNVIVQGDLTVNGTTTTLNTEQLLVEDNIITLNATVTGAPSLDSGLQIERGTSTDALLLWNETSDRFEAGISGSLETVILQSDLNSVSGNLQTDISSRVLRAGDTMTGNLILAGLPTLSGHAANKFYVDAGDTATAATATAALSAYSGAADAKFVDVAGDTMTGFLVLNADPTASGHAANKFYVDSQVSSASGFLIVEENNSLVYSGAVKLDFGAGFDVISGSGEAQIVLDLSETDVVRTANVDQSISGNKTFLNPIVLASGSEPATISASGVTGEARWSDDYVYICVGTNSWKRVALSIF